MEQNKNNIKRPSASQTSTVMRFADLAIRMGVVIALGTWVGSWIDSKLTMTKPIFTLILCLFSIGSSIYMVYRAVSQPKP